jgi:hypothetical protein
MQPREAQAKEEKLARLANKKYTRRLKVEVPCDGTSRWNHEAMTPEPLFTKEKTMLSTNPFFPKWAWLGLFALLMALLLSLSPLARPTLHASSLRRGGQPSSAQGKAIVISLSHQWMSVFQNGVEVYNAAVMTGRPALPTPTGTYHVFAKLSPKTFYSPWPPGSPYWYPPTRVTYALKWRADGYYLHDTWWHTVYGPGTNTWHYDPVYGWQWGSHGCVAMPLKVAAWLYNWAPIGTTVHITS